MKRLRICLGLAVAMAAGAVAQAQNLYPGDRAITQAETRAKTASFPCEKELNAGKAGAACDRYHTAVLQALALQNRRLAWCNTRVTREDSQMVIPKSCLNYGLSDVRLTEMANLERKKSRATYKAFDQAMSQLAPAPENAP